MDGDEECCENCRFYRDRSCRKNAPMGQAHPDWIWQWPTMEIDDWCGEWQAKEVAQQ